MKKIVIAAGTGFLGKILIRHFQNEVDTIVILTRGETRITKNLRYIHWDAKTLGDWKNEINDADVLINMTGKSVDCRYNNKNKKLILSSRIASTEILGKAIAQAKNPPKTWLNASTATIYRHSLDKKMDELSGEMGTGFSVNVARNWEKSFFSQQTPQTRKVALRTSIVLGKNGGALPPLLTLVKMGFGGKQGIGNQKFSWIHETDFARSIDFIINNIKLEGPVNIVSPEPSTNYKLMKSLRQIIKIPIGIPLGGSILEIGAHIIQTETELVLKSRNVITKKLEHSGFRFQYPDLTTALLHLIQ
ncbi:TIGR01777 family oxidoreductase [Aquimarina sp. RZ0]|uniref:TIGR01777 family oxidoreductase n=1 Tax=Aquimarina sp. RZ0 TaxID=2607730 RepID=UPI0011F21AD4|nr:TIGR01777 family oxidoreductase [Aquimarina sp. RZ0]KAA1245593.1 TIGR01777 family protein [Aquimarina sp. RZ0]